MSAILLENDNLRVIQPTLINLFNKTKAMLMQQVHYMSEQGLGIIFEGKRWVYKTAIQWAEELAISERQVKRVLKSLENQGIISIKKLSRNKSDRTNYIALNYDAINELIEPKSTPSKTIDAEITLVNDGDKMSLSSGQNVPMVILRKHTKNKDKLINLIEENVLAKKMKEGVEVTNSENSSSDNIEKEGRGDKPKNTTAQDMLTIWNQLFPKAKASMSRDLAPLLVTTFKKLDSNLDRWKHYCELVASSAYLNGEQFSLSLQWAIKFSTMDRIFNGEFGVSKQLLEYRPPIEQRENVAEMHIHSLVGIEAEICIRLRTWFLKRYGADAYKSWIQNATMRLEDGKVLIENISAFQKQYIMNNFLVISGWGKQIAS